MVEEQSFNPPWWLRNKHIQSLYASVINVRSTVDLKWEELALPDGDFVDIAWAGPAPVNAPVLILLHGLEGSVYSHYIQEMIALFIARDWRIAVMHFRSCSGRLNRLSLSYNAEYTGDFKEVVMTISQRFPQCPLFGMGFSLGGNILMRYLIQYADTPLLAAISVSMPFELDKSADYLAPFYQRVLLRSLKRKVAAKIVSGMPMSVNLKSLKAISTLRQFDTLVTTPLYGYHSVDEYYHMASSRHLLKHVRRPSLIIHAMDDPFVPMNSIPTHQELSDHISMAMTQHGGHMGFITGGLPWKPSYWFTKQVTAFFDKYVQTFCEPQCSEVQ